jgi:bromodomain adjacent to zinc finger domain protein 1A
MELVCCRKFFERVILCNSLVWSCGLTGRSGLTYQEAAESENHARRRLSDFPKSLQLPILLLMTKTRRRRLADAREDIYTFIKDRYFVAEEIIALLPSGAR